MNRWCWIILCMLVTGCEAIGDSADALEMTCECSSMTERLTPTFSCEASEADVPVYLCEDGAAGLQCEEASSATWSADDLSCSSVFCVTTDPSTCQMDCSCSDATGG